MTDLYDRKPPGPGHNQPEEEKPVVWERWDRKRIFVRELSGTYSHLQAIARSAARLFRTEPAVERRAAAIWQADHQSAGHDGGTIDRDAYRGLCAGSLRPEA